MATKQNDTVVAAFDDRSHAQLAVQDLKRSGFRDDQIGVAGRNSGDLKGENHDDDDGSYAAEGATAGLATGAGIGALWGLGILAGVLPVIGPAIAGGTLAVILSSAAAGAAAAGLAGALIGLGMTKEEAEYYEGELKAGRTIVTVTAPGRDSEALRVLRRHHGYTLADRNQPSAATNMGTQGNLAESRATARASTNTQGSEVVHAHAEQLHVEKQNVQTGDVKVRKEVHTEHKTIEVPVEREEVVIERHPVAGQSAAGATIHEGQEIRIPVREEQIHVEKQPVVTEEVAVGKRKVQETKRVSDTVRKEEIKVETDGDVNVRDAGGTNR